MNTLTHKHNRFPNFEALKYHLSNKARKTKFEYEEIILRLFLRKGFC